MATAMASKPDRTAQLLSNITKSLLDLFDTDKTFYITNESMRVLLTGLSERLTESIEDRNEDELFRRWNRNLPTTRKNLLEIAQRDPLILSDGRQMPIMSENKAAELLRKCLPDSPEF